MTRYIKSGVKELVDNIRNEKDYLMRRNKSDKYWEVRNKCGGIKITDYSYRYLVVVAMASLPPSY